MYANNPYQIFRKELGEEFRRIREEKGWSREEAAAFLQLRHAGVVENVERGRNKRFYLMFHLAAKYGKKISFILTDISEAEKELLLRKGKTDGDC